MLTRNFRFFLPVMGVAVLTIAASAQTAPTTVSFTTQTYNTGAAPISVASGDFNEDGKPDLAVVNNGSNSVQVLLNNGNGTFRLGSQFATGMDPVAIVAGNFNNDHHLDLAVANSDRSVTFAAGLGDGTFPSPSSFPTTGIPTGIIGANLLNDGLTQLATVECTTAQTSPCSLNLYQTDGHLLPSHAQSIALPMASNVHVFANLLASDDFNLDSKPDIAVATNKQVLVYKNVAAFNGTGAAKVALQATITPPNTSAIDGLTTGHFNSGAAPDLAIEVFQNINEPSPPQSVYSYLNTGNGSFFIKQIVAGSFNNALAAGDINGDGIQDLLSFGTSPKSGPIEYALGRGDGTFTTPKFIPGSGNSVGTLIVRDLNLDSRRDLALTEDNPLAGENFAEVHLNQNALTNCTPPGAATLAVHICAATASTGAIGVRAAGNSQAGVKRMEVWVDGVKKAQAFSDQLHVKVSVAAGSHQVTFVGVDLYDALVKKTVTVTVP